MVGPPKVRPSIFDLLQQIESSDDDMSRRVVQAACDSDTTGSDHAVDDADGSDTEESVRCNFLDSMAAESRSVQSDESVTSANSDPFLDKLCVADYSNRRWGVDNGIGSHHGRVEILRESCSQFVGTPVQAVNT
jgi:hypothetical protein